MTVAIQGLGRIDCQLVVRDRASGAAIDSSEIAALELTDRLTLSYLWVLGAYEIVRSLNQRIRANAALIEKWQEKSQSLKRRFERLRVPLAKFEPSRRHEATDSHVAFPAINELHGLAWQVSEHEFIARRELSDLLLAFLEEFNAKPPA